MRHSPLSVAIAVWTTLTGTAVHVRRMGSAALVVSLLLAGTTASSAAATVVRLEPVHGTDSWEYSDCGYPVHVEAEFESTATLRVGKNRDESVFFVRAHGSYREVHTNTLTGEWFVTRGQFTFRDVKATQVEGTVYEISSVQTGQPFVIEDSSGRVVVRDRGAIWQHLVFDTGGDDNPNAEFVDFLGLEVRGPHPGKFSDFCGFAGDLVGISDSSQRVTLHPRGTTASPLGYSEYLPPSYGDDGSSPLLVFLHGAGESGDGSEEQLALLASTAIPYFIGNDGWPDERPFVVLAPQHEMSGDLSPYGVCDGVEFFASCAMHVQHELGNPATGSICFTPDEIEAFLSYAIASYNVDPTRVYLTGLSCGAFGAWEYLAEYGDSQIAAVVPIAGEGRPALATAGCSLGETPLWAFHDEADDVVDPAGSIEPVTQLQDCSSPPARDARLTTYPDAAVDWLGQEIFRHDSWTRTYAAGAENDIYTWMLETSNAATGS